MGQDGHGDADEGDDGGDFHHEFPLTSAESANCVISLIELHKDGL